MGPRRSNSGAVAEGLDRHPEPAAERSEALDQARALMFQLAAGDRFERLGAIVQEHLFTGGKQLRSRLALASAHALGGSDESAAGWAAACELLHNATLVHDDLQDGDAIRRGHFTVWVRHGQAQAINAGDLLLMLPFIAVEHVDVPDAIRWHLCRAIARRSEQTVRGQSQEMGLLPGGQWDWESYAEAAKGKTSALFALPVHGAALIAGRSPEDAESLAEPFRDVGLLFQIQDDVVDLFGDKGRGERGGDLREGRVTALVAEHLRLHPGDTKELVGLLSQSREATTDASVEAWATRFERGGALRSVNGRIANLRARVEGAPHLAGEPALLHVAKSLIQRSLRPIEHIVEVSR